MSDRTLAIIAIVLALLSLALGAAHAIATVPPAHSGRVFP